MADQKPFEGAEHGDAWMTYRREQTAREKLETERAEAEAALRRSDLATLEEQTRAAIKATLTDEQIGLVRARLIDACHGAPRAEQLVERVLTDFGLTLAATVWGE